MVDAFVSIAIEKLVGLGEDELKLLCGTHEEVEKLLGILKTIHPYLHDAEVKQFNEPDVGVWLQKLKCVAYEADDVLDEWQTKSQQLSTGANLVWNFFAQFTCFRQLVLRHTVGKKIQKINGKLDDIDTQSKKFNFLKSTNVMGEGTNFPSVIRKARQTNSSVEEIFGRQDDINGIKDKLINSSETSKYEVVSLVGPGGFGKTTLAKYVFNDGEVKQHFKERIWVCVSDDQFDVASIMMKMIEAAGKEPPSSCENQEALRKKIVDEVLKDKFLLVLDDVWNEDHEKWEKLFNVIKNCGLSGSRILVTTRNENVCKIMGSAHMFQVGIVSSFEHCWSIFTSVAFESRDESEHPDLRRLGEEIVKKCKGVPLAIKTVAGVLRTKTTKEAWEHVLISDMWDWRRPISGTGILPALWLSYYHLSPPLKQCFRYCAIYPKDYRISKDKLVPQWIAHGYIIKDKNMEMEDVGENYFDELVARSLLQEPELDEDTNNITHCMMHDLVHDLAQFVTKGDFLLINNEENIEFDNPPLHCTISDMGSLNNIKMDVDKLRTFIPSESYKREVGFQIKEMQHLRVLELNSWSREMLPDIVSKLMHLRYLNLSGGEFKALPRSIGKLQNLLYFNLSHTSIDVLPESIKRLRKLRYLDLSWNEKFKALPSTIGMLTYLRQLNLKRTGLYEIPDCIGKLSLLRYLNLAGTEIRGLPESTRDLSRLQVLDVSHCKKLENLPAGIFDKMTGLKQLRSSRTIFTTYQGELPGIGLPAGIGKLSRLQRLDQFWVLRNRLEEEAGPSSPISSSSSNIGELRDLNHLHGFLHISNLDMVTSREEAASAQLCNKNSITLLKLEWSADIQGTMEKTTSEDVLQALCPCSALPRLWIERYPGRTVPTWLGDSTKLMLSGLQKLRLESWDGCADLPALGNLPELRQLTIWGMPKVRRVGAEWFGSNHGFPKLEYLQFGYMEEWEEWDNSLEETKLFFPCLSKLAISHCPKLWSLPPIFSTSSLLRIDVDDCSNLSNWLGILPASIVTLGSISAEWVNGLPSLPNLEHLKIRGDDGVSELSNHLVEYGALKTLEIRSCPNLESLPQEMVSLKQLQKLEIYNCGKLRSLPSLANLEDLTISGDVGVSELFNHLVNKLGALKKLEIEDCPNLESLPQEMASLKQLQKLRIRRCPKLKESCNKEGAQWHKIQHIPYIDIDYQDVRGNA